MRTDTTTSMCVCFVERKRRMNMYYVYLHIKTWLWYLQHTLYNWLWYTGCTCYICRHLMYRMWDAMLWFWQNRFICVWHVFSLSGTWRHSFAVSFLNTECPNIMNRLCLCLMFRTLNLVSHRCNVMNAGYVPKLVYSSFTSRAFKLKYTGCLTTSLPYGDLGVHFQQRILTNWSCFQPLWN
jgi:hypothetical protein